MKYEALITLVRPYGWFDLATLVQMSSEPRQALQIQLSRWRKAGKLLPLRRGMYALPELYRSKPINPAELANGMYAPSYLSLHWALGYYGMIPERVFEYTSVTSRAPRRFDNAFGSFSYRHVKPAAFFGCQVVDLGGSRMFLAEPEKALLDLWYLEQGEWTVARMEQMRFQAFERVDPETLDDYADQFDSPRLMAATKIWSTLSRQSLEQGVEL
jgi:predicted transcriptional regulator of viral defense system